ncbi:MAG: hypothetical protein ACYC0F_18330 [Rhodanobacter sp.]
MLDESIDVLRANGVDAPELEVSFYGMAEFRLGDPDGNRRWIGQDASMTVRCDHLPGVRSS